MPSRPPTHYYAQSFPTHPTTHLPTAYTLRPLLTDPTLASDDVIIIYLSSLHFGTDTSPTSISSTLPPTPTPTPYLHWNDINVNALEPFWNEIKALCDEAVCRVEMRVMLGGAGGAYTTYVSAPETYYALLHDFLTAHPFLCGIDLDVEETLDPDPARALDCIQTLITRLYNDFVVPRTTSTSSTLSTLSASSIAQPFAITMAPVADSLIDNYPGMGGFVYRDLKRSSCGPMVSSYNVQAYDEYDYATFQRIVKNGFSADQLVYGMLGDQFEQATPFATAMTELQHIMNVYPECRGAVLWEYGDTKVDGVVWGQAVRRAVDGGMGRVKIEANKRDEEYRGCLVM